MSAPRVLPALDEVEGGEARVDVHAEGLAIEQLALEGRTPASAHRLPKTTDGYRQPGQNGGSRRSVGAAPPPCPARRWTAWCAITNSALDGTVVASRANNRREAIGALSDVEIRLVHPFWIACADGSNWRDNSSGVRPFRTSSTIRCRNSDEYGRWLFGIVELPLCPNDRVSTKPGHVHVGEGARP